MPFVRVSNGGTDLPPVSMSFGYSSGNASVNYTIPDEYKEKYTQVRCVVVSGTFTKYRLYANGGSTEVNMGTWSSLSGATAIVQFAWSQNAKSIIEFR